LQAPFFCCHGAKIRHKKKCWLEPNERNMAIFSKKMSKFLQLENQKTRTLTNWLNFARGKKTKKNAVGSVLVGD
jgi:hypothetical protein